MADRSVLPFGRLGVPTHTSVSSVAATAAFGSVVARSNPRWTARAIISSTRGSMTGLLPAFSMPTLSVLTSTPHTSWPVSARHAAVTDPT
jgi:hypothetical protein